RVSVDKAIDAAIAWIVDKAKKLFAKLFAKKDEKDTDPEKEKKIQAGLAAIDAADQAALTDGVLKREDAEKIAATVKQQHPVFKSLSVVETADRYDYDYVASPGKKHKGAARSEADKIVQIASFGPRPSFKSETRENLPGDEG